MIVLINPWFMPLLFVLAGMSARYALEKRSGREFIMQRIRKLLIPFVFGTIFLVPLQTLFARRSFEGYSGGIFENMKYFFTHVTDLTGYDGAFTPGHLWFILFLFVISAVSLVIFRLVPIRKTEKAVGKLPVWGLLLLFIPIWLMYYIGNFGGFSLGKDLALFLTGYYVLSNDAVADTVERGIKWLAVLCAVCTAASAVMYFKFSYYGDMWVNFIGWLSVLVILALGKKLLNKKTAFTEYFNKASYPFYILHQSILVTVAYYITQICDIMWVQMVCICAGSFLFTVLAYHLFCIIPVVRKAIGIK